MQQVIVYHDPDTSSVLRFQASIHDKDIREKEDKNITCPGMYNVV